MEYKVKKGLEQPLIVHGMLLKYFYSWITIGGVCAVYLMSLLLGAARPNSNVTLLQFVFSFAVCGILFLGLKFYLGNKSRVIKMKFRNEKWIMSNVDIMKTLK